MKYLVLLAVAGVVLSGVDAELDPVACYVDGVKYKPLDEIPSDDPCAESCFCDLSLSQTTSVQCVPIACAIAPCRNGLQPIAREGECCPSCRCVVNETAYDIDDNVPNDDPCRSCTCTEEGEACNTVACADIKCKRRHGLEAVTKEGECCSSCRCVVNGTAYDIGEEIPNFDPCKSCTCTKKGQKCEPLPCANITCRGTTLRPIIKHSEGECCPSCRCVLRGIAYDIGEEIPTPHTCKSCTCTERGRVCNTSCDDPDCGLYPAIRKEGECCPVCPDCPPSCSSSYCTSNPNAVCTLPGEDYCGNRLTSCRACYYCGTERKAPKKCQRFVKMKPTRSLAGAHSIVKRWGRCVEEAYEKESASAGNFKCIRYPTKF